MADKKNNGLGLPQTRGTFQIRGIVTGVEKNNFYKETKTKTDKPMRMVNFGVKTNEDKIIYLSLTGMEKDKVFFSKTTTEDGKKKTDVQEVAWKDRFKFNKEGYRLIGINLGLVKKTDEKGNEVNDKKTLVDYDAAKEIDENLRDDQSIFVKGNIEYSHFESNNGESKHAVKFIPTQISLCKNDIDFEAEDFKETADFTQYIVFNSIKQDENDKEKFIVDAQIVNYNNIENAEFVIKNKDLANLFRKNLKPYTGLKIWGIINSEKDTTEIETTDSWGETNSMEKINTPIKRELIITGADPKTIEKEIYSEKAIEEAIAKLNADKKAKEDFGNKDEWGSVGNNSNNEDEAW